MHVSEKRGAVTLVSGYAPGSASSHSEDLRKGIESEGRLIRSPSHRFIFEMFLINDHFGEMPGEVLLVKIREDGRSEMHARSLNGTIRPIDSGRCTPQAGGES